MDSQQLVVPDIGDFANVAVIEVLVKVGDVVAVDTPLITLETEKATMDVPASHAGVIDKLLVEKGSKVSAGSVVALLRAGDAAPASTPAAASKAAAVVPDTVPTLAPAPASPAKAAPAGATPQAPAAVVAAAASVQSSTVDEAGFSQAHASPSVRKFARELGVDLARVTGSGQKGRITEADIKRYVKGSMGGAGTAAAATAGSGSGTGLPVIKMPDFASFGPVEVRPLNRVQKISGPRLHASWVNLPHVTQFDQADITDLETLRKSLKDKADAAGIKLTPLAFIVRACVLALQQFPLFNTSLDQSGENVVYKKYINIGFAADTPNGLMVPVIRDAARKDIYRIARELAELAAKARDGKLAGGDMQGGTFTISSLGGIGGTAFTPIINAPEVAILGVSRSSQQPVWVKDAFVPRLMVPLSLSYDHRVIDGANGARFTTCLASLLADPRTLVEAIP